MVCNPQGHNRFFFPTSVEAHIKQVNETKESVYKRKALSSNRIGLVLNLTAVSMFWTSCACVRSITATFIEAKNTILK